MTSTSQATSVRATKGQRTKERLLAAASAEIVATAGDFQLAQVSQRAEVSPGLPYRYFESKSDLLVAVVNDFYDELDARVFRPDFAEISVDWWVREQHRIVSLIDFCYQRPIARYLVTSLAGDATAVAVQRERTQRHYVGAAANIRTGQQLGIVPESIDSALMGPMLIGGVNAVIGSALTLTPATAQDRTVDAVIHGMRTILQIGVTHEP